VEGCDKRVTDLIDCKNMLGRFTVAMCSAHYQYFRSYESLGKEIPLKENEVTSDVTIGLWKKDLN
jgi:hypothetical protein